MTQERESYPLDVLFVGGGPACLAGAIRLAQLIGDHNQGVAGGAAQGPEISAEIGVIEKAREFGQHGLSGAVLDPRALAALIPDYKDKGCPLGSQVRKEGFYFLTRNGHVKIPDFLVPAENDNRGFHVISLQRFTKWLAEMAEAAGVFMFPATTGVEILYEGDRVSGVRTGDKGLGKDGVPKGNFEPGLDLLAKVTVFGEGSRGTLSEDLIARFGLREGRNPQVYSLGTKEVIRVGRTAGDGLVLHTLGYPLRNDQFGGGFFYELDEEHYAAGFAASLSWHDPRFDCQAALQQWKKHPLIQSLIRGGEVVAYGAKTIPEGGYFSIPRLVADGALIVGDSAGLVNVKLLKGIHYAMTSGVLAAEAVFEALRRSDFTSATLSGYEQRLKTSYVMADMWRDRNFRIAFERGLYAGLISTGVHRFTGGGSKVRKHVKPDFQSFRPVGEMGAPLADPDGYDPATIVDKLTDVFRSGTIHREDQPSHISILDPKVCTGRCLPTYGVAPCTNFCPAKVYELVGEDKEQRIQINFSNCVHCKTCVILDPFDVDLSDNLQNINWRSPAEGGPKYIGL